MGRKRQAVATPSTTLLARPASDDDLAAYCPDLDQWPRSWRVEERDLLPGQQIVDCFKPFLHHLLSQDLSRKTLRKHRDNLWLLGGELIRDLHDSPGLRRRSIKELVFAALENDGGPLISHNASEEEQRSFDSTCRRFYRFLIGAPLLQK
jgi:hypothetical protein